MYGNVQECGWRMNLRGFQIGAMRWKNMYTDDVALLSAVYWCFAMPNVYGSQVSDRPFCLFAVTLIMPSLSGFLSAYGTEPGLCMFV